MEQNRGNEMKKEQQSDRQRKKKQEDREADGMV